MSTSASAGYKATCPEGHPCRVRWRGSAPSWVPPCYLAVQKIEDRSDNASYVLAEDPRRTEASAVQKLAGREEP